MLEIVETKNELPKDTDLKCPICLDEIDLDEKDKYGVPNCVICDNGHRLHNYCLREMKKHECPICKVNHFSFCKGKDGYLYAKRKGGRKKHRTYKKTKKTLRKKNTIKNRKFNKYK